MYLNKAFEIKNWMTEELIHQPNNLHTTNAFFESIGFLNTIDSLNASNTINGIALSLKDRDDYAINIFLSSKGSINKKIIATYFSVSHEDILIRKVGKISTQKRYRPLTPGTSLAHYQVSAGTFGCIVQDLSSQYYILSNNHVLANSNNANLGDIILQPGSIDGGIYPRDEAAWLHAFIPIDLTGINEIDAALAQPAEDFYTDLPRIGRVAGITTPRIGMKVKKMGRTTGYTIGQVISRSADIKVDFDGKLVQFEDQFEIQGLTKRFSDGGDSGALIVEYDTNNAVGLLFAGNQAGTTFANPINKVLNAFDITIA